MGVSASSDMNGIASNNELSDDICSLFECRLHELQREKYGVSNNGKSNL